MTVFECHQEVSLPKEPSVRKPKFRLCKSGTLILTCKGSGHQAWIGSRFHPVLFTQIEEELNHFCKTCGVLKSVCPRSSETE
jgi:hypothetical protein